MLCLEMKLVSRLRNLSGSSSSSQSNGPPSPGCLSPPAITTNHQQQQHLYVNDNIGNGKFLCKKPPRRGSGGTISPASDDRDCSDDESIPTIRIVRDRSRSVCMPVLTSSQLRHLHRRASHHVYVYISNSFIYSFLYEYNYYCFFIFL